jgi:hypothetical protein
MINMKIIEVTKPTQSADKIKIDALKRQKDQAAKALKAQQARNKINAGQKALANLSQAAA